jgi:hypothetical protein
MGFVMDKEAAIRPIFGVPGAATLGPSLFSTTGFNHVVLSAERGYALALTDAGRHAVLVRDLKGSPWAAVIEVAPGADRLAVSPSGNSAALYYRDARRVEVITGLPDSPTVSWGLDAPDLSAGLAAMAVSDGGSAVLAATAGEPAPVFLLTRDAGSRFLQAVEGSPSLAFLKGGTDAVIGDGVFGQVFMVRNSEREPQTALIGDRAQGVSHPVAIAASPDKLRVYVANAEPAGVISLSLAGEEPLSLSCACSPTTLEPLAGGAVLRLSEAGEGPIWFLDGSAPAPRVAFVPYPPSSPASIGARHDAAPPRWPGGAARRDR